MKRSGNLSTACVAPRQGSLLSSEKVAGVETKDNIEFVREAAALFHTHPMPLPVCKGLHQWLARDSSEPDQLEKTFQLVRDQHERLRTHELRSLIGHASLGGWALCADTIDFLVEKIQEVRPASILEFGSGISSLALAWIMRRIHGYSQQPHVFSIDQSSAYIERANQNLIRHGLADCVRFLHADLSAQIISSMETRCYSLPPARLQEFFGAARPSLVVIDGPAGENGVRFGTIPLVREYLASNALIFLDDGLRDSELSTAEQWDRLRYVQWDGIRWAGKGLLCGSLCSPTAPAEEQWLEQAYLVSSGTPALPVPLPQNANVSSESKQRLFPSSEYQITETPAPRQGFSAQANRQTSRVCLFLNTYYSGFLEHHYKSHPGLIHASYHEQHDALQGACFGDSDYYSLGIRSAGWTTVDVIANCSPLQRQWAKEHGGNPNGAPLDIVLEQIRKMRPQVLYLQDLGMATEEFITTVRPYVDLIVGQIASPLPPQTHLGGFDILISSFPHFVDTFRQQGRVAYYQPLAFDPRILQRLGTAPREFPLTFVGGLSPAHRERQDLLTKLGTSLPLHCWGYGTNALAQYGVDATRLHGDVWGLEMFAVLARSSITLNQHIDVAKSNANNMRLFEATGCGALLITDYKDNLGDLFEIGREVVAYRSIQECQDLIAYYLAHPEEARVIAARGQARTLHDHTYDIRMHHTAEILARHLEGKIGNNRLPDLDLSLISYGRTSIQPDQVTVDLAQSWRSELIPEKQRALVERELEAMYRGNPPMVFRVLAEALRPYVSRNTELLEIGCASGYYYEALEYLLKTRLSYIGIDFSDAMIRMARKYYPGVHFEVGDGAALRFDNRSVPIVISSCVLLHVPAYAMHIAEAARVASDIVVLHRTPVSRTAPTSHYKKFAYGVETYELRFHEVEILQLCSQTGLELITALTYDEHPERDEFETTYVFRVAQTA